MDRHDEFALADRFNWTEWKRIFKCNVALFLM